MKFKELASLIANQEGKKHEASIGDVREILSLFHYYYSSPQYGEGVTDWLNNHKPEAKRKTKKKKSKC
jgi:hypothetical protein